MPSDDLPNDAMSNILLLVVIPVVTVAVFRIKYGICDTYRRMPLQYVVDKNAAVATNLLAYCNLVVWAYLIGNHSCMHLATLVMVDTLIGMHIQRYLLQLIHEDDMAPYHEPGPLALARRIRRAKLTAIITALVCAWDAATSATRPRSEEAHERVSYWFTIAALPALHAVMRTLVLDTQGCKRNRQIGGFHLEEQVESATNTFTITDDDDEDEITLDDITSDEVL